MTQIFPGELHVWLTFYEEIDAVVLSPLYRMLMSAAERHQATRFYFAADRVQYLVTRALVRTVLSQYAAVTPEAWNFETNAYGRPYAVNREALYDGLSFNISHTRSLIVLAITKRCAVGVDVENLVSREPAFEVANSYFATEEAATLRGLAHNEQRYRFFEYWTLKESYIKARGVGLSLPLDRFRFEYPTDNSVALTAGKDVDADAGRWQFWLFQPRPEYLVSLCAEKFSTEPTKVSIRQAIPLQTTQYLKLEFLRTSQFLAARCCAI